MESLTMLRMKDTIELSKLNNKSMILSQHLL